MITVLNNAIDILWLMIGLIAIIVLLAMFFPWGFLYEVIVLTLVVIWIAIKFWLRESWNGVKRVFRKKQKWVDIDDHNLFI